MPVVAGRDKVPVLLAKDKCNYVFTRVDMYIIFVRELYGYVYREIILFESAY